jgi:hypothetical protein
MHKLIESIEAMRHLLHVAKPFVVEAALFLTLVFEVGKLFLAFVGGH